jgi:hypothetical protein
LFGGTLARAMATGGESTDWSIQVDPEITVDGKPVHSIEISYKDAQKLSPSIAVQLGDMGVLYRRTGMSIAYYPLVSRGRGDCRDIAEQKPLDFRFLFAYSAGR